MRLCSHLTCDAAADVWYHGAWCGFHASRQFGAVIGTLSNLGTSADRQAEAAALPTRPLRTQVEADPSSEAASPAPLTDYDLERLLATNGWDLLDAELACITALGLDG